MGPLKILILDDERGGVQHLHDALSTSHKLTWMRTIDSALTALDTDEKPFDIIICGTHLLLESMFDFLSAVKIKAASKHIPFVCFRAATTQFAENMDESIENIAKILGADAYILVPKISDPETLRKLVEIEINSLVQIP